MSEVEEESSCSIPEDGSEDTECGGGGSTESQLSFFHVQPLSLSHGYESSPEYYASLQVIDKDYQKSNLAGKAYPDMIWRRENRLRGYEKWRDYKKPLDERRLCQAVSMNDTASVIHLLKQGVSADCYDNVHRSPLHLAACKGYAHIVKILLEAGANVNARDPIGNTPLHLAACTNNIDVVLLLLQAGSDGMSSDSLGRSPLQLAKSKLKILSKSSVPEQEIKNQVNQVIELLLLFAKDGLFAEKLSALQRQAGGAESKEQVDELCNLLDGINSLSITGQT